MGLAPKRPASLVNSRGLLAVCCFAFLQTPACAGEPALPDGVGPLVSLSSAPRDTEALSALGQLWVFLKYHHPAVAAGKYDWDAELLRELPKVLAAKDRTEWGLELERWLDRLPSPGRPASRTHDGDRPDVKLRPDYGDLFDKGYLPDSLVAKLDRLRESEGLSSNHYIVDRAAGSPLITNEKVYDETSYPSAGLRLAALFRYWGLIQYFFPYRHLIGEDWGKILPEFIPAFLNAKNAEEYMLACLRLMGRTHDGHAGIRKRNKARDAYWGKLYPPFTVRFVEGRLVVNRFYGKADGVASLVSHGDVITRIEDEPVEERIDKILPLVPASNQARQSRDAARLVLRGNTDKVRITLLHDGRPQTLVVPRSDSWDMSADDMPDFDNGLTDIGYKVIEGDIGYVDAGKFLNPQLPELKKAFENTKGMIIDMRSYPADDMAYTLGGYLKETSSPYALFTQSDVRRPGLFSFREPVKNGGDLDHHYSGTVVVIVNEETKSSGEWAVMAFQSARNVAVIGSTTAGADGNIAVFYLPGGIYTAFSALGVYYPDRTETQRVGVRLDATASPSVEGFREGKDELLRKAVERIRQSVR